MRRPPSMRGLGWCGGGVARIYGWCYYVYTQRRRERNDGPQHSTRPRGQLPQVRHRARHHVRRHRRCTRRTHQRRTGPLPEPRQDAVPPRTGRCTMTTPMPLRAVRVDEETWTAAKVKAETERTTVSEVVRVALRDYAAEAVK